MPKLAITIGLGHGPQYANEGPDEDDLNREQDGPEELSPEALDLAIKHCQHELAALKAMRAGDHATARKHAEAMAAMDRESSDGEDDDGK